MESEELLHELTGVGIAFASDTQTTSRLAFREGGSKELCKGGSRELRPVVDPCQGSPLSSPPLRTLVNIKIFVGRNFVTSRLVKKIT